jgi:hypothetical protein
MYSELTALLRSQGGKGRAEMLFPFIFVNIRRAFMVEHILGFIAIMISSLFLMWLLVKVFGG